MRRTICFLMIGGLVWVCGAVQCARGGNSPPNIVVFLVDDLGATDVGCFGSTFYETPNVDRLARSGMRFTAAYAACPVCSPSRASMMTGRYPQRTGITDYINGKGSNQPEHWKRNTPLLPASYSDHLALNERTIAEALRDAGYTTFFAGKWHLGGRGYLPTDQGFDINKGGFSAGHPRSYFSPYHNPFLKDGPPGEHLPARLAEETCRFIAANTKHPFFVYLAFYSVHIPLQAPRGVIKKYEAKAASRPSAGSIFGHENKHEVRLVQNHPTYAGMVESMDTAVGKVLAELESMGIADRTLIVFTSDNGGLSTSEGMPTSNYPLRAGKGWLYEGGIRVPTIIRWPGITKPGSMCATPIISFDYYPTLLEAVGRSVEAHRSIDGESLVPLLQGKTIPRRTLYWDYPHYGNQGGAPGGAVREGWWKLIEWRENDVTELFDLQTDPSEEHNLASSHQEVVARLKESLAKWRQEVGSKSPTPNPRYQPSR
ncbi:MAG TPA: sulfatase [Lacipirellulaceae bacterium]|nr:sulfatase [Lacipirellulaceae bacterium]